MIIKIVRVTFFIFPEGWRVYIISVAVFLSDKVTCFHINGIFCVFTMFENVHKGQDQWNKWMIMDVECFKETSTLFFSYHPE